MTSTTSWQVSTALTPELMPSPSVPNPLARNAGGCHRGVTEHAARALLLGMEASPCCPGAWSRLEAHNAAGGALVSVKLATVQGRGPA